MLYTGRIVCIVHYINETTTMNAIEPNLPIATIFVRNFYFKRMDYQIITYEIVSVKGFPAFSIERGKMSVQDFVNAGAVGAIKLEDTTIPADIADKASDFFFWGIPNTML